MALKRVWIPSPNYSSRGGATPRLIVLHTAEGARTIESLGGYFQGNVSASSHVGADDKVNTVGEYVKRENKAWTQSDYNSAAVSIELCAFAAWSLDEWHRHPNMLANCAAWVAEEAAHYGIPITRLSASQAQGSGRGVCQHVDLGAGGGGHHDCGPEFPIDEVLNMARGGAGLSPSTEQEENMITSAVSDGGTLHVWWVVGDGQTVRYRYQRSGDSDWKDGGVFTKAPKQIAGLSASLTNTGTLEVFVRYADGNVSHCWQKKGSTSWSGGAPGKQIAEFTPLPA
jgi:N-acetylmuramoyl-L-alanine amidase-like protein